MDWALVDVPKVVLVAVAFVFYYLDMTLKGALRLFPESAGADLCLAAIAFDASVLLDRFDEIAHVLGPTPGALSAKLYILFLLFLVGLVAWVLCLRLAAPPRDERLILPWMSFAALSRWLSSMIGLSFSVIVILLVVEA